MGNAFTDIDANKKVNLCNKIVKNMILNDIPQAKKKVVLFPEIVWVKTFLSLTRPHSRMCIRIYAFDFKNKQKTTKITRGQKAKEAKDEKRISVENLTEYDDIVCEFALCTDLLDRGRVVTFSW